MGIIFLSGCTETQLFAHMAKKIPLPGDAQYQVGHYKVGTPYTIFGRRYYPREQFSGTETGIASWYGPNFHGKSTANGEIFDQNALTAAHRTLQMPSIIRVTNLENGYSLILRVNDRGPYARNRVLDVSKKSAELLGFKNQGTARVKIEVLENESRHVAEMAKAGLDTNGVEIAMNRGKDPFRTSQTKLTSLSSYTPPPDDIHSPEVESVPVQNVSIRTVPPKDEERQLVRQSQPVETSLYVQAGAFTEYDNARKLSQNLSNLGETGIYPVTVNGTDFYRVRIGPLINVASADQVLNTLALQNNDQAMIVIE